MTLKLDAVLLDAFGTLFAPVSAGSPAAHLCRLLASDGVIVSPERAGRAILAEVELYRGKFPHVRCEAELCNLEYEASDLVLAELGLAGFSRERMRRHLLDLFKLSVFPDTEPALDRLQQRGVALGVVSNYNSMLTAHLDELGLANRFRVMVNSADYGEPKPRPGIFHHAVRLLKAMPDRVLYVGDDVENDYYGARQAGLQAVLLNRDAAPVADEVRQIQSLTDLPGLLERNFA